MGSPADAIGKDAVAEFLTYREKKPRVGKFFRVKSPCTALRPLDAADFNHHRATSFRIPVSQAYFERCPEAHIYERIPLAADIFRGGGCQAFSPHGKVWIV